MPKKSRKSHGFARKLGTGRRIPPSVPKKSREPVRFVGGLGIDRRKSMSVPKSIKSLIKTGDYYDYRYTCTL